MGFPVSFLSVFRFRLQVLEQKQSCLSLSSAGVQESLPCPGVEAKSGVRGVPSEPRGRHAMCFLKCIAYF